MTVRVSERPALQVIALLLAANDLAATRIEAPDVKPGTTALRISSLADVNGGRGRPVEAAANGAPPSVGGRT